jgi:hypoxanthine phosphoribosyltransferase
VRGRTALVLDTVVDTGATAGAVLARARACGASDARLACLVDKPARRRGGVRPDWSGFVAPDRFLVGYGLDHGGRWRTLPYVAAISP